MNLIKQHIIQNHQIFLTKNFLDIPLLNIEVKHGKRNQEQEEFIYQIKLAKTIPVYLCWIEYDKLIFYDILKVGYFEHKDGVIRENASGKDFYFFRDILNGKTKPIKVLNINE